MLDLSFGLLKFHALYKSIAFCETSDRTVDASLNDMLLKPILSQCSISILPESVRNLWFFTRFGSL